MKELCIILFVLYPFIIFGQSIQKDQVNRIEGYRVINTTSENLDWSKPAHKVYGSVFINKAADTTMSLLLYFKTPTVTTIFKGTKVILSLDDESELEFFHAGSDKNYGSNDLAYAFITLDAQSAQILKNHSVVQYRVETNGVFVDVYIRKNSKDKISNIIKVLEESMRVPRT